jgi:signal transduction histidine kinase
VNQVLDLAKIESGHADWRIEDVALAEVIDQAIAATSKLLDKRGIRLQLECPGTALTVRGDRDRLVQVLVNLLSNAAKFAPEGGRLDPRDGRHRRATRAVSVSRTTGPVSRRTTWNWCSKIPPVRQRRREAHRHRARPAHLPTHHRAPGRTHLGRGRSRQRC